MRRSLGLQLTVQYAISSPIAMTATSQSGKDRELFFRDWQLMYGWCRATKANSYVGVLSPLAQSYPTVYEDG